MDKTFDELRRCIESGDSARALFLVERLAERFNMDSGYIRDMFDERDRLKGEASALRSKNVFLQADVLRLAEPSERDNPALSKDETFLAESGYAVAAIKRYRERVSCDIKTAADAVRKVMRFESKE